MRANIVGGLLATGLLMAGCGGTEPTQEESSLNTRKDELPDCYNQEYERVFYSEPEMINEVGWWWCNCPDSLAWTSGEITAYSTYTYRNYCPPPPPR